MAKSMRSREEIEKRIKKLRYRAGAFSSSMNYVYKKRIEELEWVLKQRE